MNKESAPELSTGLTRMPAEYELRMSLGWLSNLRWIAGGAVLAATWIASSILGLGIPVVPLTAIGVGICLYNAGFKWWLARIQRDSPGTGGQPHTLARLQIADDPQLSRIPVLMVSAITASEYASSFPTNQLLSIREFISKPVEPKTLLRKIKRHVR